jgi:hypothetical protein
MEHKKSMAPNYCVRASDNAFRIQISDEQTRVHTEQTSMAAIEVQNHIGSEDKMCMKLTCCCKNYKTLF